MGRIFGYNVNEVWGWGEGQNRTDEWDGPHLQGESAGTLEPVLFCLEFPETMANFENGEETPSDETWRKVMRMEAKKESRRDFGRRMLSVKIMRWIDHSLGEWVLEVRRKIVTGREAR